MWKSSTGQIYEIEFSNIVVENSDTLTEYPYKYEYDDWNREYLEKFYRKLQNN